jgi:hypothetical protein
MTHISSKLFISDLSKASRNDFHSFFSIARAILNEGTVLPMLYVYAIPILEGKDWTAEGIINRIQKRRFLVKATYRVKNTIAVIYAIHSAFSYKNMSGLELIPAALPFIQYLKDLESKRRSKDEMRAGKVLHASGLLVVLLLEIQNMLMKVTSDLKDVHAHESKEKREEIIGKFKDFIVLEKVMPGIKSRVNELAGWEEEDRDKFYAKSVRIIREQGQHIIDLQRGFSDVEIFTREGGFDRFRDKVRNAKTEEDVSEIRGIMDELVQIFDKDSVEKARDEYSNHLKIMITKKYPSLPEPPA